MPSILLRVPDAFWRDVGGYPGKVLLMPPTWAQDAPQAVTGYLPERAAGVVKLDGALSAPLDITGTCSACRAGTHPHDRYCWRCGALLQR